MTGREDMLALAERVEQATGDDAMSQTMRALNADILRALGWREAEGDVIDPTGNLRMQIPFYVGSLDAAMTLVPDGAGLTIARYWISSRKGPVWSAEIATGGIPSDPRQVFDCYDAATPALALIAAALRARASTGDAS